MGFWLLIGLAVGIAAILIFRGLTKRSAFSGRVPAPLEEVYAPVKDQVSFEVFSEVWSTLGKAYSIDPRLLRPTDTFNTLSKMDSWTLGKGEGDMAKWLEQRGLGTPPRVQTVLELATWVQSSMAGSTPR